MLAASPLAPTLSQQSLTAAQRTTGLEDWLAQQGVDIQASFVMDPQNAALVSEFASYGNGIEGSDKFLPESFANSPEIKAPDGSPTPEFVPPCPRPVLEVYNKIWTNLRK